MSTHILTMSSVSAIGSRSSTTATWWWRTIDELLDRYAQPVYELEPEPRQPGAVDRLAAAMRGQAWVGEIKTEPDVVRVFVNDPKVAGAAILPLVVASGVNLVRYERARPSLEDVFLRLVAESGPPVAARLPCPSGA